MDSRRRNDSGFTLIEIITVLILLSIIAATVLGRSINTESTDLVSQIARVRNHLRFAQSMAMKYGDKVWGVKCDDVAGERLYWVFRLDLPVADPVNEPDLPANKVQLPGESDLNIDLSEKKVQMATFDLFFDRFGRPYHYYEDEADPDNVPLTIPLSITLQSIPTPSINGNILITPETGLIQ